MRDDAEDEKGAFALGMAHYTSGKYSEAQVEFERVLDINPENHRARLELARSLMRSRKYSAAKTEFEKVLATNPPATVRQNIERYVARIEREAKRR